MLTISSFDLSVPASADALAGGLVRDLAGQIDGVAVHDGLGHARADADTLNAHSQISLNGHRRW
jgi:hypothetical protein